MIKKAIVFVIYDLATKKYLVENRTDKQTMSGEKVFPGGKVKNSEIANLTKTLFRELKEELGIKPKKYKYLGKPTVGINGFELYSFLVTSWEGKIPNKILDKGSTLEWLGSEEFKPNIKPVREILKLVKSCVAQSH